MVASGGNKVNPRLRVAVKGVEAGIKLLEVLPKGEKINLGHYGNHARGAKFTDGSHWVTQKLEDTINEMFANSGFFWKNGCDVQLFAELENGTSSLWS
jgi:hypothetical protein